MTAVAPTTITPSGAVPDYNDRATFGARVLAWDLWTRDTMVPGVNAAAANVYANAVDAYNSAVSAAASTNTAQAAANYKGEWSALTGALNMPASVSYGGFFYALNANLANVATAVPGVSSSWTLIVTQEGTLVIQSATTGTALNRQLVGLANGAASEVLAPVNPQPGWEFWVAPCNRLSSNVVRRNGSLIDNYADDIMLTDPYKTYHFVFFDSLNGWRPLNA